MEKVIYKCMTKATSRELNGPRYSQNWVTSKRGSFKIYNDKITCGSWNFDIEKIDNVILYETKQMLIPVKVLKFEYKDKIYQFGFNPWAKPMKYLDLEYKHEKVKMKYSKFSIILRIALLTVIITHLLKRILS